MKIALAVAAVCIAAFSSAALAGGGGTCTDSKLLSPLGGCSISDCSKSDFDAAEIQISQSGDQRTKHLEGKIEKVSYSCTGKSALQVRRNAEQAFKAAGFAIDFTGYDVPDHYVTAHKGAQWVAVVAHEMTGDSSYDITGILTGDMQQEMVSDVDAWASEIGKTGHVAVYGIEFDTGKATIRPESAKVLGEVLDLLKKQPSWKLKIVGHTDNTGTKALNQPLSEKRAGAVVGWLVQHGIAAARLSAAGMGDTKPVADNKTDAGRARNRRVELVKQ